jgi:glycosyltransferase involved in cell wall biosynthesis
MNLLIISYIYAPDRSPRAYRWRALCEHWAREGHRVDVISAWKRGDRRLEPCDGVTVHRVGGGLVERLRSALGQSSHRAADAATIIQAETPALRRVAKAIYRATVKQLFWPDYAFHWYPAARAQARALCRAIRYDAMISVSHPFTPHLVALSVKHRFPALRWVADIGDPFSLLEEIPLNNPALYRRLNRRAEEAVLERSDAVAVTIERCRADYTAAFPASARKIAVIPPLLSLPTAAPATPVFAAGKIHLIFIGTLYRALRDPSYLLALFAALHRRRDDLHLHFFGALNDCAPCFDAAHEALGRHVHLHGTVPRATIAAAMRSADILINIGNSTSHQLPSKLVEYAAAARPILNLATSSADTGRDFLRNYPASLTLEVRGEIPDRTAVDASLAFIAAAPPLDASAISRFLAPYTLERVAAGYDALLAPGPKSVASRALRESA